MAARLLEQLAAAGLSEVALNLHHGADVVERVLGDGPVYLREKWLRGTAGALRGAGSFLGGGDFLVASSDGVHEIDIPALIEHHRAAGALATITVKRIARPETCAIVDLGDDGLVRRFVEKPAPGAVFTDLASIGVNCFRPDVLELIPDDRPFDISGELIPLLLDRGLPVAAYPTTAWWADIGTPEALLEANLWASGGEARVYARCTIAPDAVLEPPALVGPDAVVGPGAVVRSALVLPGAQVAAGAVVEDSILGDGDGVLRSWLHAG